MLKPRWCSIIVAVIVGLIVQFGLSIAWIGLFQCDMSAGKVMNWLFYNPEKYGRCWPFYGSDFIAGAFLFLVLVLINVGFVGLLKSMITSWYRGKDF